MMKTNTNYMDKALDVLIDEAAAELYEREGSAEIPKAEFSPEHEKRMKQLFKKERRKYNLRRATAVTSKVACVLLAVVLVMSVAIYSVEAWRVKFLNFIVDTDAPDTEIKFTDNKQNSFENDVVKLGYVPKGFEVEKNKFGKDNVFLKFRNGDKYFQLKMNTQSFNSAVNTEKGSAENITINGYEGVFVVNKNENVFLWHDGTYTYRLLSNLEKEELIAIAKETRTK